MPPSPAFQELPPLPILAHSYWKSTRRMYTWLFGAIVFVFLLTMFGMALRADVVLLGSIVLLAITVSMVFVAINALHMKNTQSAYLTSITSRAQAERHRVSDPLQRAIEKLNSAMDNGLSFESASMMIGSLNGICAYCKDAGHRIVYDHLIKMVERLDAKELSTSSYSQIDLYDKLIGVQQLHFNEEHARLNLAVRVMFDNGSRVKATEEA